MDKAYINVPSNNGKTCKKANQEALRMMHEACATFAGLTEHGSAVAHLIRSTQIGACICTDLEYMEANGLETFGAVCERCGR